MATGQVINPEYCYTKGQLRKFNRIHLMMYAEARWGVPRAKSTAPEGYEGDYTATFRTVDEIIDGLIWLKYQADGHAGSSQLLKGAPREEAVEDSKEEEVPTDAPEGKTVEVEVSEKKEEEKEESIVASPPHKTESSGILELPDWRIHLEQMEKRIHEHLEDVKIEIQEAILDVNDRQTALGIGLKNISLLQATTLEACTGTDLDSTVMDVLAEQLNMLRTTFSEEEEEEDTQEPPTSREPEPSPSMKGKYTVGEERFTEDDLMDEEDMPFERLSKIAATLGLEIRGLDRITSIGLIQDRLSR